MDVWLTQKFMEFTCWTVVYIYNSSNMIHVNINRSVKFPHIKAVQVVVLASRGKHHRLHGIPSQGIGSQGHYNFPYGSNVSSVIKHDRVITGSCCKKISFNLVKFDQMYRINSPLECSTQIIKY